MLKDQGLQQFCREGPQRLSDSDSAEARGQAQRHLAMHPCQEKKDKRDACS